VEAIFGMRKFFLKIYFITGIFLLVISPVCGSDPVFQGEIVGHIDFMGLIGKPVPPNYNGTIAPVDVPSFQQVVIRLHYSGETLVELTRLDITQEITSYGYTWNYSRVIIDLSPSIMLLTGDSYTFLVNGSSNINFIDEGLFYVKITTKNMGIVWTSFSSQGLFHSLPTWPLSTSPSITTSSTPGWFFLLPFFCAFIVLLHQQKKNDSH
jgi:hypothetical protein